MLAAAILMVFGAGVACGQNYPNKPIRILTAEVGGSADVVSGAFEHTINMQAKGINIVAIALEGRYSGIVLGVPAAVCEEYPTTLEVGDRVWLFLAQHDQYRAG